MIALLKSWRAAAGLAVVLALLVALGVQSWRLRAAVSDARAQMARAESWRAALDDQVARMQAWKAQAAQRDFDTARTNALALAKRLERPGYSIDWDRGVYVANPSPKKE
jgi:hypothetical protein